MKRIGFIVGLFIFSASLYSQDLTGIWRGNFYAGIGPFQDYYKYEVQIDQLKNNSLQGVTYSYHTTVFYGKATFTGIWFPKSKSAIVKELKLIELKIANNSDACAMTCNLDYSKEDGKEILSGSFTSINTSNNADCGSGTVYLEKVPNSDFHKEDFLLKKNDTVATSKKLTPPAKNNLNKTSAIENLSKTNAKKLQVALGVTPDGSIGPKTLAALKKRLPDFTDKVDVANTNQVNDLISRIKKINSGNAKKLQQALGVTPDGSIGPKTLAELKNKLPDFTGKVDVANTDQVNDLVNRLKNANTAKTIQKLNESKQGKIQPPKINGQDSIAKTSPPVSNENKIIPEVKAIPVPDVIKTRSNPLIKTITTNSNDIHVELYDNGDIDGDTITVYDNNRVIAWKKGLTDKPIILNIKTDDATPEHEFVMVADNLGAIPPNTALMIITTGGKRYQLYIASDKQKNAKVVVKYEP